MNIPIHHTQNKVQKDKELRRALEEPHEKQTEGREAYKGLQTG